MITRYCNARLVMHISGALAGRHKDRNNYGLVQSLSAMTVIAWDGQFIAADKRALNSGLSRTVTKLHKAGDSVVAFSGDSCQGLLMVEWVRAGCNPETFPASQKDKDDWATIIVATKDGIRYYERGPYPIVVEDPIWASGTGRDFALTAMHLGKTAIEAVQIASLFQSDCGNGVDWFDLDA